MAAVGVVAFVLPFDAHARRPTPPDAWWTGLDPATTTAPAEGVKLLRLAPAGRVRIPGGTFTMGSTLREMARAIVLCQREVRAPLCHDGDVLAMVNAEGIAHPVTLASFEMDRTEVRVADYARCVSSGACAPADISPTDGRFARPDLPVTHVRWDDAVSYCHWKGGGGGRDGRLPSEAEWEYAARGVEGRTFPWGNLYNPHLANHGSLADDSTDATDGFAGLAPVGSFPDGATPLGLLDMAGNAAEWVADVFELDDHGLPLPYADAAEVDPKPRAGAGMFHVVRGGSYVDGAMWLRGAARDTIGSARAAAVGFRCAADAP